MAPAASAGGSGTTPSRAARRRSAAPRWPVMPLACAHRPHTWEVAGRPLGAAVGRESVDEGVARRVVALSGGAEEAGGGGRTARRRPAGEGRSFVQVPGGVDLGAEHLGEPFRGLRGDDTVVQEAGGVDDTGQGPLGGDPVEQGGHAVRSAASHAATVTSAPRARSSPARAVASGAASPRRPASTRCRTPVRSPGAGRTGRRACRCRR